MTTNDDILVYDVAVVGGGLAGLQAATTAAEKGLRTILISKRRPGRSGSSGLTSAGYAAVMPGWDDDSVASHFEDTFKGGGSIGEPDLIRALVDDAPEMARRLIEIGGQFRKKEGLLARVGGGDHSKPRSLVAENHIGTDLTLPMVNRAEALGVTTISETMVVDLITDATRVVGLLAVDTRDHRVVAVAARETILATGGCGQLYPLTSNPTDVTGDGFALAARVGARLRDMEFIQFYPWRCLRPFTNRVSVQPQSFSMGVSLHNRRGERFMHMYDPHRAEATTRDIAAQAIFDQVRQGLGVDGGVRIDFSMLSEEEMEDTNPKIYAGLQRRGINYRTYEMTVGPESHYFMGGVAVDAHGRTSVPGLFAVGEVSSGIQGGNRLSNNALPEALVMGHRAASAIAEGISQDIGTSIPESRIRDLSNALAPSPSDGDRQLDGMRREMQQAAFDGLGITRNATAIDRAHGIIHDLRKRLALIPPGEDPRAWFELDFLSETALAIATAAAARTESRAAHHRDDYPQSNDSDWRGSIFLERSEGDEYDMSFQPAAIPAAS